MNVLLTGAFGNVGTSALIALLEHGHHVRCFDLRTPANEKAARRYAGRAEVLWGDLRRPEDVAAAVRGQDVVVHLAFIIPTLSATGVGANDRPDWSREINVGGTRNLIEAVRAMPVPAGFIFSSSLHVYGDTHDRPPLRTVDDPVQPDEPYSHHKVECEAMLRASGLQWSILRFGAVLPLAMKLDAGMFDVPLENRIEFVHTRDVGLAVANAVASTEIWGKVLLIGGGPGCRLYYRQIAEQLLAAIGVGALPDEAFTQRPFPVDWLDTAESERLLHYQTRCLDDYTREMAAMLGFRRHLVTAFRPLVRAWLLRKSPYYRAARAARSEWHGRVAVVTGASSGIGEATARRLAREGMRTVLIARRADRLEALAGEIRAAGGEALVVAADLCDEGERRRIYELVRDTYGPADVLVNNAGFGWYGFGSEMPWPVAARMMDLNAAACVHLTLLFLSDMRARDRGHIVNVGSITGALPTQGSALYSATKAFVATFTAALYRELRGTNVHASLINPGVVATGFFAASEAQPHGRRVPGERFGIRAELVADRIWSLLRRPRRVLYVPGVMTVIPWIELMFGWLLDILGPILLRREPPPAV